jgi:hypothetical protein
MMFEIDYPHRIPRDPTPPSSQKSS